MVDASLAQYVSQMRQRGYTPEQIKQALHASGWPEATITEALGGGAGPAIRPTSPAPVSQPSVHAEKKNTRLVLYASLILAVLLSGGGAAFFIFGSSPDYSEPYIEEPAVFEPPAQQFESQQDISSQSGASETGAQNSATPSASNPVSRRSSGGSSSSSSSGPSSFNTGASTSTSSGSSSGTATSSGGTASSSTTSSNSAAGASTSSSSTSSSTSGAHPTKNDNSHLFDEDETESDEEEDDPSECGADFDDCFLLFAETCEESSARKKVTTDLSGYIERVTFEYQIKPVDGCTLEIEVAQAGYSITDALQQELLDEGQSEEEIQADLEEYITDYGFKVGDELVCDGPETDLTFALEDAPNNIIDIDVLSVVGDCTGPLLETLLG